MKARKISYIVYERGINPNKKNFEQVRRAMRQISEDITEPYDIFVDRITRNKGRLVGLRELIFTVYPKGHKPRHYSKKIISSKRK